MTPEKGAMALSWWNAQRAKEAYEERYVVFEHKLDGV
jgi:hypothetical protein